MTDLAAKKLELARLRRALADKLRYAFDGLVPDSRPTPAQLAILQNADDLIMWIVAANRSGKSQLGGRAVSWWFDNAHPYMERPVEWGTGPLQILVVGRLGEQMESELWEKKIKPFLKPGTYKTVKIGNILQRVEHRNGNRMIFLSHHDALHAREKVQAFTANVVWLDEMPDHAGLVTELVMRVLASKGRLYGTFTPLIRNEEIRKIVDSPAPGVRKYQLSMLDNPIYAGREAEVAAQVRAACANEDEFRARMYGDWYAGDQRVFAYDLVRNRRDLPAHYVAGAWRHVAVVDPSASGKTGLVVGAEDPATGQWYVVKAKYLQGKSAYELVEEVERELVGYRLVLRLCDCNPAGFYKEAARRGLSWIPYTEKADRKLETIDKTNSALLESRLLLTPAAVTLEEELVTCAWSDRNPDKIINASRYHTVDCLRYLVDRRPDFDPQHAVPLTETQELRQSWKRKQQQQALTLIQRRTNPWKRTSSLRSLRLQ